MNWRLFWLLPLFLFMAWAAWGHDPSGHGAYTDWYVSQRQENGFSLCCGDIDEKGGDAHFVDVKQVGDQFFVKIDEAWVLYPRPVNPYLYNPVGHNVAWFNKTTEGITFYCLRLATGS